MTGFVGGGIVLNKYFLNTTRAAADSLMANHNIYGVYVEPALGYRFSMGLRLRRAFSIEMAVTSISTDFLFRESLGPRRYAQRHEPARFGIFASRSDTFSRSGTPATSPIENRPDTACFNSSHSDAESRGETPRNGHPR